MSEIIEVDDGGFLEKLEMNEEIREARVATAQSLNTNGSHKTVTPALTSRQKRSPQDKSQQGIPVRLETALRVAAAAFLAFSLSYADLGGVIPSSQKFLVGIFGSIIPMRIPTYLFAVGSFGPMIFLLMIFGLASATMVLTAATVSTGFYIFVTAVWAFIISSLRYGAFGKGTYIVPGVLVVIVGMIGVGLQPVVSDGVVIKIDLDILNEIADQIKDKLNMTLSGGNRLLAQDIMMEGFTYAPFMTEERILNDSPIEIDLDAVRGVLLGILPPDLLNYLQVLKISIGDYLSYRIPEILEQLPPLSFTVPSGFLEGRTVTMDLIGSGQDHELEIKIAAGGTWLIKQLWTQSGLDNPLAVMQNFLVAFSWAMMCVAAGILITPWRTIRFDLVRVLLPSTLKRAAKYLRNSLLLIRKNAEAYNEIVERPVEDTGMIDNDAIQEELAEHKAALLNASQGIHGGVAALPTVFEPRILEFQPRTNTWIKLMKLMKKVDLVVVETVMLRSKTGNTSDREMEQIQDSIQILETCAASLVDVEPLNTASLTQKILDDETSGELNSGGYPNALYQSSMTLGTDINEWVEAMYPTKTETLSNKNLLLNLVPWVLGSLAVAARLIEFLLLPLQIFKGKHRVDWGKFAHYVKFSGGFTALLCMSTYWEAYRDFELNDRSNSDQGFRQYITLEEAGPGSFSGWTLIAYAFATMPTAEGTIKKCVLRMIGTLCGAFCAWFSLKLWHDSNAGMVAWLTIISFIATYFAVDDDPLKARMGTSKDIGYGGFYVVLTQSVIVMEFLAGKGDRDSLVVNRIVSNVTGIAMAGLLAIVPPTVYGGDPYRAKFMLEAMRSGIKDLIQLLQSGESKSEEFLDLATQVTKSVDKERTDCLFLLDDAKRLSKFSLYKTDPLLEKELIEMTTTGTLLSAFILATEKHLKAWNSSIDSEESIQNDLLSLIEALENGKAVVPQQARDQSGAHAHVLASLLFLTDRVAAHEQCLSKVRFGIFLT